MRRHWSSVDLMHNIHILYTISYHAVVSIYNVYFIRYIPYILGSVSVCCTGLYMCICMYACMFIYYVLHHKIFLSCPLKTILLFSSFLLHFSFCSSFLHFLHCRVGGKTVRLFCFALMLFLLAWPSCLFQGYQII